MLQDGRICEVVAWDGGSSARHTILDSIVTYILHQHMDAQVWGSSDCVDWVLGQKGHARGDQLNARRYVLFQCFCHLGSLRVGLGLQCDDSRTRSTVISSNKQGYGRLRYCQGQSLRLCDDVGWRTPHWVSWASSCGA